MIAVILIAVILIAGLIGIVPSVTDLHCFPFGKVLEDGHLQTIALD